MEGEHDRGVNSTIYDSVASVNNRDNNDIGENVMRIQMKILDKEFYTCKGFGGTGV